MQWQNKYYKLIVKEKPENYLPLTIPSSLPKDGDVVIPGFAVIRLDNLGVIVNDSFTGADSVWDCFIMSLALYLKTKNRHHPRVHPSWYGVIEEAI